MDPATRRGSSARSRPRFVSRRSPASRCSASTSPAARPSSRPSCSAICLGGIGLGIIAWSHWLLPGDGTGRGPRHPLPAPRTRRPTPSAADETASITRRSFLVRTLAAAFAGLGAALAIPSCRSVRRRAAALFETPWAAGTRVVGLDGQPVGIDDLPVDGVLTVFPEGAVGSADGQTLLIRVADGAAPAAARPDGLGAAGLRRVFEAVHACRLPGRPLPRGRAQADLPLPPVDLRRPDGARRPTFGPAARPLPQLPIRLAADGTFVALGDFPEPVGPALLGHDRWLSDRDRRPRRRGDRPPPTELERVAGWLDSRTGIAAVTRGAMRKIFPDHWSFLLGEIALFAFVILLATGTFLTFFYTPDARETIYDGPYAVMDGAPCRPPTPR